jgi:hypothetical protein
MFVRVECGAGVSASNDRVVIGMTATRWLPPDHLRLESERGRIISGNSASKSECPAMTGSGANRPSRSST